jgi:hypothetical protein
MKRNIFIITAILLVTSSLFFVKCKEIQDPADGLKLIINYNVIKASLSVSFIDAATGEPIGYVDDNNVNVHLTGKDADKMLDITGASRTSYNSAKGFLGFGVDPSYSPSPNNPLEFNIVAQCNGYASISRPVQLWEETHTSMIISMVNLNNLPNGVTSVTDYNVFVSDSVVDDDVVVETAPAGTAATKARLTIKEGTKILDENGNTLKGSFTTKMVYYNNWDDASLSAFPGGITPMVNLNGNMENVMFYSGGFASIEIADASGKKGKTFKYNDLELVVEMTDNTHNKNTDATVEDQDTVPLWSYDLESAYWNLDEWTLIEDNNGVLEATAGLSHLSIFNFDWWWPIAPLPSSSYGRLRFNPTFKSSEATSTIPLEIIVRKQVDNTFINRYLIEAPLNEEFNIGQWGLGNTPVVLEIRSMCNSTPQLENITDPSQGVYNIDLQNVPPNQQTVTVYFEGWCPNNPDVIIRPSMPFVYRDECNGGQWIWSFMHEGYATLYNMSLNHVYRVGVYYDGEFFEEGFTFENANVSYSIEFTAEVCNIIGQ